MMRIFKIIWPFLKNKYVLAVLFFAIWIIFFDQNNILDRINAMRKYYQMQDEKTYYFEKIKSDSKKLQELKTDRENLEKFAREQYYMKKDDEDIFIVVEN